jgi:preprotein translocase subunit SecG
LAGALGGMGGQSAFGTKAGDLFTRITIGVATAWIVLCIISVKVLSSSGDLMNLGPSSATEQQSQTGEGSDQGNEPASPAGSGSSDTAPKS